MKLAAVLTIALVAVGTTALAQGQVEARAIIDKINNGETINYQNTRITGDLDLTRLKNQTMELQGDGRLKDTLYINTVTVPVRFTNCTFDGKIIGYFNPDNNTNRMVTNSRIYNTNFDKEVLFKDCNFSDEVNFKYSKFKDKAGFSGSRFEKLAFFKYTEFSQAPDFSQGRFNDLSFKYVKFPAAASFESAVFNGEADFKYAEFSEKANFGKARFSGMANFKYAHLKDPLLQGAQFTAGTDFKYTQVNNRRVALDQLSTK